MLQTRLNLHLHGVGINDPINGVWLINFEKNKEQNWDSPASPPHRKLHRYNYETWINTNFGNAATPKALFLNRLRTVKVKIKRVLYLQVYLNQKMKIGRLYSDCISN